MVEDYHLPRGIQAITGQRTVPFGVYPSCSKYARQIMIVSLIVIRSFVYRSGDGVISTFDTCIASEVCEEMFTVERFDEPDDLHNQIRYTL